MVSLDPVRDRQRHIMREAAQRWKRTGRGEKVTEQLAALGESAPAAFDSPLRQQQYAARNLVLQHAAELRSMGQLPIGLERKIGSTLDFMQNAPSEAARKAGRPVARIVTDCDPKVEAQGFATAFLVSPRLLITNWHVFPDVGSARGTGANFFHERGEGGVAVGETFEVDPDDFFLSNERLDFALVGLKSTSVAGAALNTIDPASVTAAPAKILIGQPVNIIQHPDGGPKSWVTENDNRLIDISDDGFMQYTADTLQGSSGSPVFSKVWELAGVHHSGVPEMHNGKIVAVDGSEWNEDMGDDKVHWIANEGIRASAIIRALSETKLDDPRQQSILDSFLTGTGDPADEVKQLMQGASTLPPGSPNANAVVSATGCSMTFTGPVTIVVTAQGEAPSAAHDGLEQSLRFDPDYVHREGYRPEFLGDGLIVPVPSIVVGREAEMLKADGKIQVLDYHHYSLAMNASRRLQMWSAVNVDYAANRRTSGGRTSFGTDRWAFDPRIPKELQIGDRDFYDPATQWDRGHVVRREDSAWGDTPIEAEYANSDTFHWTNCTPQHAAFNRASPPTAFQIPQGAWGGFEMYIQSQLQKGDTRACILAGPVLAATDPVKDLGHGTIAVPIRFWKVVVVKGKVAGKAALQAYGFMLDQADIVARFGIEFSPGRFARFHASLQDISAAAGVDFDPLILAAEQAQSAEPASDDVPPAPNLKTKKKRHSLG